MNEQRHILIFPVSLWNGMAGTRRVKVLVDELAANGNYTFSNLIIGHPKEFSGRTQTGSEQNIPFCQIGYRYYNVFTWLTFWLSGFRFIYRIRKNKQHNFLYCYQETDVVTFPLLVFARLFGYKIIVDLVEDNAFLKKSFANGLAYFRVRSGLWLLNSLPIYADAAIAISQYLLQKTEAITKGRIPVALIPISVNLNLFESIPVRSDSGHQNKPVNVFYGGSFGDKDGIYYLLRAIKICQSKSITIRLVLTGIGSPEDMAAFWRWVDEFQLNPLIDYKGYLLDTAYIQTLKSCDVFCMTRINSSFANAGFPFKLGEMLATGKPVIATKVGDVSKYLTDFENALVIEPENAEQLADRLLWLIKNYAQASAIGIRGKQVAEQHFSASTIARKLDTVFNELIYAV